MTAIDFYFTPGQTISVPGLPDDLLSLGFLPRAGRFSDASLFDTQARLQVLCMDPEPLQGLFTFAYDSATATLRENATLTANALEDALNSVSTIRDAGLVDVQPIGRYIFDVRFRVAGAREAITVSEASLGSLSRVTEIQTGDESTKSIQRINMQVGKLATVANGDFTAISAGTVSVSTFSTGDATQPQAEEVSFGDRQPEGGTFAISINGGTIWSDPVNAPPNGYEIQKALDGLDHGEFVVTRSKPLTLISRRFNGANTAIQVNGDGLRWPEGKACNLDFADCLRILERHHPGEQANIQIILETSDDFSDSAEPVRRMVTIAGKVPVSGRKGASVGVI